MRSVDGRGLPLPSPPAGNELAGDDGRLEGPLDRLHGLGLSAAEHRPPGEQVGVRRRHAGGGSGLGRPGVALLWATGPSLQHLRGGFGPGQRGVALEAQLVEERRRTVDHVLPALGVQPLRDPPPELVLQPALGDDVGAFPCGQQVGRECGVVPQPSVTSPDARDPRIDRACAQVHDEAGLWWSRHTPLTLLRPTLASVSCQTPFLGSVEADERTTVTHQPDLRRVQARPIQIIAATKVVNEDTGEPMIAVGIGESIEQSEFLVMSIRDARSLRFSLGNALAAAPPSRVP